MQMKYLYKAILFASTIMTAPVYAGDFHNSSVFLENRISTLEQQIQDLNDRLTVLENDSPEPIPEPACNVSVVEVGQSPFPDSLGLIPGRLEAENFDLGGEGVAYHDETPGNAWGFYRTDVDVDIKPSGDPEGGQYQLGLNKSGEWVEYTVCAKSGVYDIKLRVLCGIPETSGGCGSITVFLGGTELGVLKVPYTGSWDTMAVSIIIPNVTIIGGNKILRLAFSGNYLDLNWIHFIRTDVVNNAPTDLMLCPPDPEQLALGRIVVDTSDLSKCNMGHDGVSG